MIYTCPLPDHRYLQQHLTVVSSNRVRLFASQMATRLSSVQHETLATVRKHALFVVFLCAAYHPKFTLLLAIHVQRKKYHLYPF